MIYDFLWFLEFRAKLAIIILNPKIFSTYLLISYGKHIRKDGHKKAVRVLSCHLPEAQDEMQGFGRMKKEK